MKSNQFILCIALILIPFHIFSCERGNGLAGKYNSEVKGKESIISINLELKNTGQGSWSTDEDNVDFSWDTRGGKLLIHTKNGGVITGTVIGEEIALKIPGMDIYTFKRIKE